MSNTARENHSLIERPPLPMLASVPSIQSAALMVRPDNIFLNRTLISFNERFGLVGKKVFLAKKGDTNASEITVGRPTPEQPWWPTIDGNRFTKLTGRNAWAINSEDAMRILSETPPSSGLCNSLEEQYYTSEKMEAAMPENFTIEEAVRFGEKLAETLAFFELTAPKKESDHQQNLSLDFFFEGENVLPDIVVQVLKPSIHLLRSTIATKLEAMKVVMGIQGIDTSSILRPIWGSVIESGKEFADEHYEVLKLISVIGRTKDSREQALDILRHLDFGKLREIAR